MTRLVLVHGFTGSPASFDELLSYVRARQPALRVFRPALLGHGARPDPVPLRFEEEVDRLAEEIRGAGFAGAHLCGYSLGARLALGLLARHARLFSSATLIAVHPGLASDGERAARVGGDERWCQLLLRQGSASFLRSWEEQPLFATQRALPAARRARQRAIRQDHSADGLQQTLRVLGLGRMPNLRGVLGMQPLRVELLVGALDAKFVALAQELAGVAAVRLECFEGVGHNLLLEAPEHVARVLTRALEVCA